MRMCWCSIMSIYVEALYIYVVCAVAYQQQRKLNFASLKTHFKVGESARTRENLSENSSHKSNHFSSSFLGPQSGRCRIRKKRVFHIDDDNVCSRTYCFRHDGAVLALSE